MTSVTKAGLTRFAGVLIVLFMALALSLFANAPAHASQSTHPLPGNKNVDCVSMVLNPGRALQNGDHINADIKQGGRSFQVNAYVDRNIAGGYDTLGVRIKIDGVDQAPIPLTYEQVKTGNLTFVYSKFLTGNWSVVWVQFNSWYFNQDRNPKNVLECESEFLVASAAVSTTPPTCDVGEKLVWGSIENAVFTGTPNGTAGPGTYSVTATADQGAKFPGDKTTQEFNGTLAGPLPNDHEDCLPPGNTGWIDEVNESLLWMKILTGAFIVVAIGGSIAGYRVWKRTQPQY